MKFKNLLDVKVAIQKLYGYVDIEPRLPLERTAELVEVAISGLNLVKDKSGQFEEFPAFVGKLFGLSFTLLGIPAGKTKQDDSYELGVSDLSEIEIVGDCEVVDISIYLWMLLERQGDLRSCVPKK